jgi:23S rRNA (uridine2552-2'-O)-methyltransferase
MAVVDLGAAPGGWSQLVRQRLGGQGTVVALDILDMPAIPGVHFIRGDFREVEVLAELERVVGTTEVDLVLSDMAPNMSGVSSVDQARAMELAELARDFAQAHLKRGGAFLVKLFQGAGFDAYVKDLRSRYGKVTMRKPKASRARSPEVYALATDFRKN